MKCRFPLRRKTLFVLVSLFLLVDAARPLHSGEPTDADQRSARLIADLVSSNKAPRIENGSQPVYAKTYDREAQKRVYEAWNSLLRMEKAAFPQLFVHRKDRHYSVTEPVAALRDSATGAWNDIPVEQWMNLTVGQVCDAILSEHLERYGFVQNAPDAAACEYSPDGALFVSYIRTRFDAAPHADKKWWDSHKHLSLYEMQVEVLQWAVEVQSRRFALEKVIYGGERRTQLLDEAASIGPLEYRLAQMKKSRMPLPPREHQPPVFKATEDPNRARQDDSPAVVPKEPDDLFR